VPDEGEQAGFFVRGVLAHAHGSFLLMVRAGA
jgi:hypothetical protein